MRAVECEFLTNTCATGLAFPSWRFCFSWIERGGRATHLCNPRVAESIDLQPSFFRAEFLSTCLRSSAWVPTNLLSTLFPMQGGGGRRTRPERDHSWHKVLYRRHRCLVRASSRWEFPPQVRHARGRQHLLVSRRYKDIPACATVSRFFWRYGKCEM